MSRKVDVWTIDTDGPDGEELSREVYVDMTIDMAVQHYLKQHPPVFTRGQVTSLNITWDEAEARV